MEGEEGEAKKAPTEGLAPPAMATNARGRHRFQAELERLEQELKPLKDEVEKLEKTKKASALCQELLLYVETKADPLLPVTRDAVNPSWDRWFEGPQDSPRCGCWTF